MKTIFTFLFILAITASLPGCAPTVTPTPQPEQDASPTPAPADPTLVPDLSQSGIDEISSSKDRIPVEADPQSYSEIAAQMNAFGLDMYRRLSATETDNLFLSPYSIALALSMTYAGAAGLTAEEMAQVLHYQSQDAALFSQINGLDQSLYVVPEWLQDGENAFQLNIANALWGQNGYPFKSSFLDLLAESFGAGMNLVDFVNANEQARGLINDWVAEETEDKIRDLIPPGVLDEMTRLVLTNAIYFNANWAREFVKDLTTDADFYNTPDTSIRVPMMQIKDRFSYQISGGVQMVEIPYLNSRYSMVLAMPESGDLNTYSQNLTLEQLSESIDSLQRGEVILRMPKFEFESSFSASEVLKSLGMETAFSPDAADFSGMYEEGAQSLYISDVIHKAFVSVDEEGTEAAAATAVIAGVASAMPEEEPVELIFDHPFLFLIRDNQSGLLLFIGHVVYPLS